MTSSDHSWKTDFLTLADHSKKDTMTSLITLDEETPWHCQITPEKEKSWQRRIADDHQKRKAIKAVSFQMKEWSILPSVELLHRHEQWRQDERFFTRLAPCLPSSAGDGSKPPHAQFIFPLFRPQPSVPLRHLFLAKRVGNAYGGISKIVILCTRADRSRLLIRALFSSRSFQTLLRAVCIKR